MIVLGRPRGERPSCRGLGFLDLRSSLHHVPNPVRGADHAGTTLSGHTWYDADGNLTEYLRFSYHLGAVNSVRLITDAAGAVVETYDYDEYGKATIRDNAGAVITSSRIGNFFTFTAREFDAETGLLYYRARYYDPTAGVFLQRDPAGFVDGYNLYGYAGNSPLSFRDPFGLEELTGIGWLDNALWKVGEWRDNTFGAENADAVRDAVATTLGKGQQALRESEVVDAVQTGLDAVSMSEVPVVSQAAGAASGGLDLAKGDLAGAGLAAAGMVPGAGAAADAVRLARRVDKCADAARAADKAADAAKAANKSNKQLKKEYEALTEKPWPKEPSGRSYDLNHKKAKADGGTNTVDNVEPMQHDAHMRHHKDNGDFARWGARAHQKKK
jgi:RHS repeat-associated protein